MDQSFIEAIVRKIVDQHNAKLVELVMSGGARKKKIQVFVDTLYGITVGECEKISRLLQEELNQHLPEAENYILEVSSPGIDRPLMHDWQYRKNIGRNVRIIFTDDQDTQKTVEGKLVYFDEKEIHLEIKKEKIAIPFEKIIKTKVLVSW